MLTGCRLVWDPNTNFISDAYKTNSATASGSMDAFRYFNDARFNFYKDDFAMHKFSHGPIHHGLLEL